MIEIRDTTDLASPVYQDALAIRLSVFVNEQGVPAELEVDGEEGCVHFVLYQEDQALATCRLLLKDKQTAKLQRMAVLKEARGLHLGQALMVAAEKTAKEHNITRIILGAQNTAIGFYKTLAYSTYGPEFLDAGISHFMMEKNLV